MIIKQNYKVYASLNIYKFQIVKIVRVNSVLDLRDSRQPLPVCGGGKRIIHT